MRRCLVAVLAFVCGGFMAIPAAQAQITWYVDDDSFPSGSGTPGDPFFRIQVCIDTAADGDTCLVAPGTYLETINFLGKAITLHSPDGPDVTIISANYQDGPVVTCTTGEGPDTVIDGFTVTLGLSIIEPDDCGGGMLILNSSPTVKNCMFTLNAAGNDGGGLFAGSGSSPTVSNCTFFGNAASNEGGGLFAGSGSSPTVSNCTFLGNTGVSKGGGMYNSEGSNSTVTNCTFDGNNAASGGGMYNRNSSPTVTNCMFDGNNALSGGGMLNSINSSPAVTNCTFTGNSASSGGGMYNFDNSDPAVTGCTFSGNSADVAGGGGMRNSNNSSPTVSNCTFSGNTATYDGGGMRNTNSSPTVSNCTFAGNLASNGGGIHNDGSSPTVTNCTFSGNDADIGRALAFDSIQQQFPSNLLMSNCILRDGGGEVWNNDKSMIDIAYSDVQGGWPGEGNIDLDPLFVEAGYWDDNGTPKDPDDDFWVEGDYHLLPGSPCIDAGDNTAVPEGIVTDLDGNPRFVDDPNTDDTGFGDPPIVDMGAYEFRDPCADDDGDGRVTICHIPPGNPDNAHSISVSVNAIPAHLAHGDSCGACEEDDGLLLMDGESEVCSADVNGDGVVNAADLALLLGTWGQTPGHPADFNNDEVVDAFDLAQVLGAWGLCR